MNLTPMKKSLLLACVALAGAASGPAWGWEPGRMTGGGSIFCSAGNNTTFRVTHGFVLNCQLDGQAAPSGPNNLEINWGGGNNFHLTTLTESICSYTGDPSPPRASFNTMHGTGTGTLNKGPATIRFTLTDFGEPGTADTFGFTIENAAYDSLRCYGTLDRGNHQAHRK